MTESVKFTSNEILYRLPKKPFDRSKGLFNSFLSWFLKQRISQIEGFMEQPMDTQDQVFRKLLSKGSSTAFGKAFHFQELGNIHQFRNRVPVSSYEDIWPYIDRCMKGEQQVLWPTEIKWFAKSSGTTGAKSKFIPVSKEALEGCHFNGGRDLMALYCHNRPDTKVFTGRGLVMGGSHQVNQLSENSRYGDVSAVMMQNMPWIAHLIRTPDLKIALMEDWEEKIERMAEQTRQQNVTHIAGVPTWTLVLIKRLFEKVGVDNLREIWPNLELYIHGGVSFTPYRKQFAELIRGEGMEYLETYNASEGFFAIQDQIGATDMLLMLDYGIFYEFIPMDEVHNDYPKTLLLEEVELGKNYAVVITSNAGLWRYKIGDTVRFTSISPYRIQVSGRIKHFINAFGEELIVDNSDFAIAEACAKTGAKVAEYTAAPVYFEGDQNGSHEWLIEFSAAPPNMEAFTEALDLALQSINSDYESKRYKDIALRRPLVRSIEQGTFYKWLKSKGKLGGQHKVPRLSNERNFLEEILNLVEKDSQLA